MVPLFNIYDDGGRKGNTQVLNIRTRFFLSGQKVILCAILNFAVAILWRTVRNRKPRC